jgi:hypothetical protein
LCFFIKADIQVQFVPYMLLIGLLLPVTFWLPQKKYPKFGFTGPWFVFSRAVLF